ncbi:DUF2339 domain-containing protein [Phenylobacterium sp.]|uniref:DUF2339 domain-containing protein n=1 Tax=Phenylobacterium sp. TaxID=1871053 RepID=UPI0030F43957
MEWVLILAVAAWLFVQGRELSSLKRRLDVAERALDTRRREQLDEIVSVLPEASPAERSPEPPKTAAAPIPDALPARKLAQAAVSAPEVVARKSAKPRQSAAAWLSENGLAWLGGGALALGGLFLVTYAVQRGVFTPQLRLIAAVVTGLAMIAASEAMRRLKRGNALAAALAAGAGSATLYGAIWAAERLYGFIDLATAGPLLGLISAGLLGLAFRHGAPLALLAVAGGYGAPLITGGVWNAAPLVTYLAVILLAGHAVSALRRWGEVGLVTTAGAMIWVVVSAADWPGAPPAILVVLTPVAAATAGWWLSRRPREAAPSARPDIRDPNLGAGITLAAASVLSLVVWNSFPASLPWLPALTAAILAALGAALAVRRLAPPEVTAFPFAAAVLGVMIMRAGIGPLADVLTHHAQVWTALLPVALIAAGLLAGVHAQTRAAGIAAAAGAVSAALCLAIGATGLHLIWPTLAWIAPAVGVVLVAFGATALARRSDAPNTDLSVALWIWSGAYVLIQALYQGLDPRGLPTAYGVMVLAVVLLHLRLGWRGLGAAAIAAVLAALAAVMGPDLAGKTLAAKLPAWMMALATAAPVGLVLAASWRVRRREPGAPLADSLGTGALLIALTGAFVLLRVWSSEPQRGMDSLTEASLRTILLMASGLLSARVSTSGSWLSRWRPHIFLAAGLLHAFVVQTLAINPLWGQVAVQGPPILDGLMLAYLAPALLAAAAARRWASETRSFTGAYAAAALAFAVLWGGMEIRRLFQGVTLDGGVDPVGRAEAAAYAVLLLITARSLVWVARRAAARASRLAPQMEDVADLAMMLAFGAAIMIFGYAANPWWGPINRPLDSVAASALLLVLYALGGGLLILLSAESWLGRAAKVLAAMQVFILVTLGVRMAFRGPDLAPADAEARLETWVFSAVWALYGLAVMILGVRRHEIALRWTGLVLLLLTTAKVFLFDMARLDGVIRAASFLALGVLLITGALAARRFGLVATHGGAERD